MKKQKNKLTIKKILVIFLFIVATILSVITVRKIKINYNLADYLDKSTQTKIALNIIEDEFGMTGNIQVMAQDVSIETAEEICNKIEKIDNVIAVNFDKNNTAYYKDNNALYIVIIDGDDYSENSKKVASDIKNELSEYEKIEYGGTAIEKQTLQDSITSEMTYILVIALLLVLMILLITSQSWLEPIILLLVSGVAILINRGTNFFFGEISYITNSISTILQLALSIDYSIVLLHMYRKEKERSSDNDEAMKKTIKAIVKPVSASALTTIAGLLALLFMSFHIGFDIGIVLIKGIVVSLITSMTLLPTVILIMDKPMCATKKKAFSPKGKIFCKISYRASKIIVPLALLIIVICGIVQSKNTFIFSDTKTGNANISNTFGNNNSVVVLYKNYNKEYDKEEKLIKTISNYNTKEGKTVLSNYTAYSNTVREMYDIEKTVKKLEISENDAEMLFTMYNLYNSQDEVKINLKDFIDFASKLIENDRDAKEYIDEETKNAISMLKNATDLVYGKYTADELYMQLMTKEFGNINVSDFAIKQLYGIYLYDRITENEINFMDTINFIISSKNNENIADFVNNEDMEKLSKLYVGLLSFNEQMDMLMTKESLSGWFYKNYGVMLSNEQLDNIFSSYFLKNEEEPSDTIPFLPLMNHLVEINIINEETVVATINNYSQLYATINSKYTYQKFLPTLTLVAKEMTDEDTKINLNYELLQQIYIMYFYNVGMMPIEKIKCIEFIDFTIQLYENNQIVKKQLTNEELFKLLDMRKIYSYTQNDNAVSYQKMNNQLSKLSSELKSNIITTELDEAKVSGVYIKYTIEKGKSLTTPIMAYELLDFVTKNMDTNILLNKKMSVTNRDKVQNAQNDINKANNLLISKNYNRMLLSIDLPNESEETYEFVEYLTDEVKKIFGDDAYITGEIVSTYDLKKTFSHDNLFITIFTIVSIFVIVLAVFKSLSLPIILVTIIQGAIFIAMSTQIASNEIFFMSYIISTCILMGATIDYGILMSSNYVDYRKTYDKDESLELSVQIAMPTIFTSGLILIVCGFVIHFISSQNSISTVGLLIGIGTICSTIMVTIVLPSVLYLLDKFVVKLTLKKQ